MSQTIDNTEIKQALNEGLKELEAKAAKTAAEVEKQIKETNDLNHELKAELERSVQDLKTAQDRILALEQKAAPGFAKPDLAPISLGQAVIKSTTFKSLANNNSSASRARIEVKNTLISDSNTVLPQQVQVLRPGPQAPLSVYSALPHGPASSNLVQGLRETTFNNNASPVLEAAKKAESDLDFEPWDYPVRTIAHWLKVSKALLSDAPAVAAYIDNRLRYGLMEAIDYQLINGDGTGGNLGGLAKNGNHTGYIPTAGDNLIDAIGKAKWALWEQGFLPDKVFVNPRNWGQTETAKGSDGHYLYGFPGTVARTSLFDIEVIPCPWIPAGKFMIGAFNRTVMIWDRENITVDIGFVNDDFTKNLMTLRAEARLAFEVSTPSAILGGDFST